MPQFDLEQFTGRVRLFPLPDLVLFPHVVQPLHVFEPRYRALLADALAGDRLIAMAVLAPGWEPHYEGRPALYPTACLGRVTLHEPLPDGRSNLLLAGIKRLRLLTELPPDKPFREAQAELIEDADAPQSIVKQSDAVIRLLSDLKRLRPTRSQEKILDALLSEAPSLAMVTDIVASMLRLSIAVKMQLLAEPNVDRRAEILRSTLHDGSALPSQVPFPPDFSIN